MRLLVRYKIPNVNKRAAIALDCAEKRSDKQAHSEKEAVSEDACPRCHLAAFFNFILTTLADDLYFERKPGFFTCRLEVFFRKPLYENLRGVMESEWIGVIA